MSDDITTPGFVQETVRRLRIIQKASRKEGFDVGGATVSYDLAGGTVTGTFVFPIEQTDNPDTGESVVKAVDFIE